MPTALPWFVVFTLARYRPRNALMNVITDKRSWYADRRYLTAAGIALSSRVESYIRSISPRIGKSQFAERVVRQGSHRGNVSLSFNERPDTKAERKIAFSVQAGATIFLFFFFFFFSSPREEGREKERVRDKAGLRFSWKYGSSARQRPKCSYFRLGCWRERLLIFFAK